jgi:Tfp pilus assembly protein PilO
VIVAVLLPIVWLATAYRSLTARQDRLATESESARTKLAEYNRIATDLPRLLEDLKDVERSRANLLSKLYAKQDILALLDQVREQASRRNLEITNVSPSLNELLQLNEQMKASSDPLFLTVTIALEGDFVAFGRFLRRLETEPYFRGVNLAEARTRRDSPESTHLTISFRALLGYAGGAG